ncbi:MAG: hypothetical protein KBD63_03305, partial [Bacteriovoracaceae bacterium]|nr:hypothetical protein [Bacteriovoracaceae bacterium]
MLFRNIHISVLCIALCACGMKKEMDETQAKMKVTHDDMQTTHEDIEKTHELITDSQTTMKESKDAVDETRALMTEMKKILEDNLKLLSQYLPLTNQNISSTRDQMAEVSKTLEGLRGSITKITDNKELLENVTEALKKIREGLEPGGNIDAAMKGIKVLASQLSGEEPPVEEKSAENLMKMDSSREPEAPLVTMDAFLNQYAKTALIKEYEKVLLNNWDKSKQSAFQSLYLRLTKITEDTRSAYDWAYKLVNESIQNENLSDEELEFKINQVETTPTPAPIKPVPAPKKEEVAEDPKIDSPVNPSNQERFSAQELSFFKKNIDQLMDWDKELASEKEIRSEKNQNEIRKKAKALNLIKPIHMRSMLEDFTCIGVCADSVFLLNPEKYFNFSYGS